MYKGIAVSGKMLSGKGTFLTVLDKCTNVPIKGIAFADKLKLIVKELLLYVANNNPLKYDCLSDKDRQFVSLKASELLGSDQHPKLESMIECFCRFSCSDMFSEIVAKTDKNFRIDYCCLKSENIDSIFSDSGKPRQLLQYFGTEYVRNTHPTAWVDYVFMHVAAHPETLFVITDARFPNEMDIGRANNFLLARVVAEDHVRLARGKARDGQDYSAFLTHSSETALDSYCFDVSVDNNGNMLSFGLKLLRNPLLHDLCRFTLRSYFRFFGYVASQWISQVRIGK